jgi:hypothetical protein
MLFEGDVRVSVMISMIARRFFFGWISLVLVGMNA